MPNVNVVLAQEITRLSKRVVNVSTKITRRLVSQHRRDLASLKRQVASLGRRLALCEKRQPKDITAPPEVVEKARFRAAGLRSHRAKLGLSAADYAKLLGVTPLTVYHWESGKARPRRALLPKIVAVRGLGKREAVALLAGTARKSAAPARAAKPAKRGALRKARRK